MSDNDATTSNDDHGFSSEQTSNSSSEPSAKKRKISNTEPKYTPITYKTLLLSDKMHDFFKEANRTIRSYYTPNAKKMRTFRRCLDAVDYTIDSLEKANSFLNLKMDEIDASEDLSHCSSKTPLKTLKTKESECASSLQDLCVSAAEFCAGATGEAIMLNSKKMDRMTRWLKQINRFHQEMFHYRGKITSEMEEIDANKSVKSRINIAMLSESEIELVMRSRNNQDFKRYLDEWNKKE